MLPDVPEAGRRILAVLTPDDVLLQLCREVSSLVRADRVFASYESPDQPWVELLLSGGEPASMTPAMRSALRAVVTRLCNERGLICWRSGAADEDGLQRVLASASAVTIWALPLNQEARTAGAIVWTGREDMTDEVTRSIRFLADCAATALDNASRYLAAGRHQIALDAALAERRQVEERLAAERAMLRSVFTNAPACIALLRGSDHVFELANPPYKALLGNRPLEGLPVRVAVPELGDVYFDLLDRVYRTGEPFFGTEMPAQIKQPDGSFKTVYFNFVYQPVFGARGDIEGIIGFGYDVSENVLARKRLEDAHRVTNVITSNATLALFMMDARQHCTFMNPAAEKMTGFSLSEVQDRPLHYFIHHSHPDGTPYPMEACPIDRALPTQNQTRGEDVFVHKDGRFYAVAFTASPIVENGSAVGTVIEVRDTTEDKAAQRERERMVAELQAAVRARDEFLAIASHELRTPLTPLQLELELLKKVSEEADINKERLVRKLEHAGRQTQRLAKLVENLLDVSRISGSGLELQREGLDLGELVRDVAERFGPEAQRAGSDVTVTVDAPVVGTWDRSRIEQVVANLISNAIKYGSGKPVDVHLSRRNGYAVLTVTDHGIGIDPVKQTRIFERFERAVSLRHYGGLGLGLFIVREIVKAHGGSIEVQSEPGRGSTFTISLPVEPEQTPP